MAQGDQPSLVGTSFHGAVGSVPTTSLGSPALTRATMGWDQKAPPRDMVTTATHNNDKTAHETSLNITKLLHTCRSLFEKKHIQDLQELYANMTLGTYSPHVEIIMLQVSRDFHNIKRPAPIPTLLTLPRAPSSPGTEPPSLRAERRDRKALCFVIRSIMPEARACTCLGKQPMGFPMFQQIMASNDLNMLPNNDDTKKHTCDYHSYLLLMLLIVDASKSLMLGS